MELLSEEYFEDLIKGDYTEKEIKDSLEKELWNVFNTTDKDLLDKKIINKDNLKDIKNVREKIIDAIANDYFKVVMYCKKEEVEVEHKAGKDI